jgi:hypothetical protein
MDGIPLPEIESLATELVQRRWAARAAVVTDGAGVVSLCIARAPAHGHARNGDDPRAGNAEGSGDRVARMVVESLDEQSWIYVDLGTARLVARLTRATTAAAATSWLIGELARLGVTVEREPLAQD